ncbi:Fc region receptor II [Collichthys lucidus]|uniref:Fc region receptor II n=1 Tax=Collichthys lucidus TaxID=240159 RepID=A0A4U5W065_COLLU|nr:Fc region receptor II [Collichthys lucidus]
MEITTLCAVVAALRVVPNRSQFFQYEEISLSCEQQGNSSEWTVKRNTSRKINQDCFTSWGRVNESLCVIDTLYHADSGVYWCESAAGECSDPVNITVTRGPVILESPALPVTEGDDVTLRCTSRMKSSSNLTTDFYKDGRLFWSSSTGSMTIYSVSKSDEGEYECNISGAGQSPDSRLIIRGKRDLPNSPLGFDILLPVVVVSLSLLSLVSVLLLCLWRNHKDRSAAPTFYTKVKAENT